MIKQSGLLILMIMMLLGQSHAAYHTAVSPYWSNGDQLGFHVMGRGDRHVLILGGGPGFSSWNLEPLQLEIARSSARVYLMDMRGVGEMSMAKLPSSRLLDTWLSDMEALRQHLGIERWTLVGHSWGGLMALLYAQQYRQHVERILLLNPVDPEKQSLSDLLERINAKQQLHRPIEWDKDWDQDDAAFNRTADEVKLYQIRQVLPTYFADFEQGERYAAQFSASDFEPEINARIWQEYDANPVTKTSVSAIDQPVHFLECDQDLLMPENQMVLKNYLPHMKTTLLQQCAHFPWVEQKGAFRRWLFTTLNQGEAR